MLSVTRNKLDDFDVYRLKGTFDAQYAASFRNEILNQIASGQGKFIFNMTEVEFIDSTGLGYLVSILKTVVKNQGKLYLVQPSELIYEVFVMTKLDGVFPILQREEEAV